MLEPEQFSSDIKTPVLGLHAQALAWQGLRAIASAWRNAGHPGYAERAEHVAARLAPALRRAVSRSQRRLGDGSLFLPMSLDSGEPPYDTVTESRAGSYWNLVAPYALASGLLQSRSAQARGALRYLLSHGSRLLGMVRAAAFSLYGPGAKPAISGTDQVYGVNMSRFLAEQDQPDQLVLSLYGQLAAGMTPNTFVAGEAASVAPLDGLRFRAMYLPPNATANDSFLETLRLMLVQDPALGAPAGLCDATWMARRGEADRGDGRADPVRARVLHTGRVSSGGPRASGCTSGAEGAPSPAAARRAAHRFHVAPARVRPCDRHDRPFRNGGLGRLPGADHVECGPVRRRVMFAFAAAAMCLSGSALGSADKSRSLVVGKVRIWRIAYRSHNGVRRSAFVAFPSSYRPGHAPPIPLVISPHGRGVSGRENLKLWGQLPAVGGFGVVSPDGQGRLLSNYSWGSAGQIDDLARMPQIVKLTLPWVHVDSHRVYAVGGSMGGQEALLLVARHPRLLAGAAAFDPVVDFSLQYREFPAPRVLEELPEALERPHGAVAPGARPRRARRPSRPRAVRLRAAQPADVRPRDRVLPRPAPAVVEQEGRDRDRPATADGASLQRDLDAQPERRADRVHGWVEALGRDAREDAPSAVARALRPAAASVCAADRPPREVAAALPARGRRLRNRG